MDLLDLLPVTGLLVAGLATSTWVVSLLLRDASVADVAWGPGFVLVAWSSLVLSGDVGPRGLLLAGLTTLWGIRLAVHIQRRNRGKGEDPRYARWREAGGPSWPVRSLFTVFLLQGAILWVVSLPLQTGALASGEPPGWLGGVGVVLFLAGFALESTADRQLARFRADPENRGKVLDTGVWRYSRHPNYFGDALAWWGLWLLGGAAVGAWWTVIGPVLMTILLRHVSGVSLLERTLVESRPGYRDYMDRTSAFVPWPPGPGSGKSGGF